MVSNRSTIRPHACGSENPLFEQYHAADDPSSLFVSSYIACMHGCMPLVKISHAHLINQGQSLWVSNQGIQDSMLNTKVVNVLQGSSSNKAALLAKPSTSISRWGTGCLRGALGSRLGKALELDPPAALHTRNRMNGSKSTHRCASR
jgi:hypothetical protein